MPKHAAVVLDLGRESFVYEDARYFGRLTLDTRALARLGPEPLSEDFTAATFGAALARSRQAIKVKLLDQSLVAGVGNIYASEALFRARIAPQLAARKLSRGPGASPPAHDPRSAGRGDSLVAAPFRCIMAKNGAVTGCFILAGRPARPIITTERLRVYDRKGLPCPRCQTADPAHCPGRPEHVLLSGVSAAEQGPKPKAG